MLYSQILWQIEQVTGAKLTTLHIVGGGSKNTLLNQMTADGTGRTVVAGPVEATAIGNVLLQALTLGHVATHADLRKIVRASFRMEPCTPRPTPAWKAAHERFSKLK